ncbi:hypothetical protein [Rhizobium sp. NXC24]|uniref:hypothetical protein n=1 Tax=Rhizobium sp. NXC24 TaxID=2048897 RepID=UPI000CF2326C|nr:hypothetical protein [Rhizobium sp. NXC24]
MFTSYGKLKLVTIFQLSEDGNIAKLAEVTTDPKLTPAQWGQKPEEAAQFQSAEKSLMSMPPLEMCPPLIPAKLVTPHLQPSPKAISALTSALAAPALSFRRSIM